MRRTVVVVLLLLAAALPLAAQSLTGTITGVVKDEQGGVLPGVTLTLAGKTSTRTTVTDAEGAYPFAALDPGTYSVTATLTGFRPKRQGNVVVSLSRNAEVEIVLGVGGLTESVDVVGESPVVDVASSATDNALSQDMLFNLPIRPTNAATDLLNYIPGINNGVAYGGSADYGNGLLIDGVDTRDPSGGTAWTFYNFNIVEEVQAVGIGAAAEFGAFSGAIIITVTKSGGNRFGGLFDVIYTKGSLSSSNLSDEIKRANPALGDPAKTRELRDFAAPAFANAMATAAPASAARVRVSVVVMESLLLCFTSIDSMNQGSLPVAFQVRAGPSALWRSTCVLAPFHPIRVAVVLPVQQQDSCHLPKP